MIDGVVFKTLDTHADERGFFRELIRSNDPFFADSFGQWSHSMVQSGVIKAWHLHRLQTDWWYIALGLVRVGLYDTRAEASTYQETMDFLMGDRQPSLVIKIPPGVAHGYKILTGPAHVFYVTSHIYDPQDDLRMPEDAPEIEFDWQKGSPIQ